jgi:hypothetical protein
MRKNFLQGKNKKQTYKSRSNSPQNNQPCNVPAKPFKKKQYRMMNKKQHKEIKPIGGISHKIRVNTAIFIKTVSGRKLL